VTYATHSKALIDYNPRLDQACDTLFSSRKTREHYLGILEWWERSVPLGKNQIEKLTSINKASFNQNITIKFSAASGSAIYTVVPYTFNLSGSASYQHQLFLSIAFTQDPKKKKIKVKTLPEGNLPRQVREVDPSSVSPNALERLNSIQLENTLRNLQVSPE
jgi:hypothetical protein